MTTPLFSVCIPAYNRAKLLPPLLDSIFSQDFDDYEVVITEDASRERAEIRRVAEDYQQRYPGRLRLIENDKNLGFDGNIRKLVAESHGQYCLFMGNDDLLAAGAMKTIAGGITRHPNVGVVLRSYAQFDGEPDNVWQEFRYFPDERFFPAGGATAAALYRRSVVICGVVIDRETALRHATTEHDGTLLYQIYLVACVLFEKNGIALPQIVALYRKGGIPEFGNAEAERGKFVPEQHTVDSSVHFMRGMMTIARAIDQKHGQGFYKRVLSDVAAYSFPVLSIQADKSRVAFTGYWWQLCRLGFWPYPLFHLYYLSLLILGERRSNAVIALIKRRLGYTPKLGSVFTGKAS
jgi:glycosyltransferase involved in cell wall biosynthesis